MHCTIILDSWRVWSVLIGCSACVACPDWMSQPMLIPSLLLTNGSPAWLFCSTHFTASEGCSYPVLFPSIRVSLEVYFTCRYKQPPPPRPPDAHVVAFYHFLFHTVAAAAVTKPWPVVEQPVHKGDTVKTCRLHRQLLVLVCICIYFCIHACNMID